VFELADGKKDQVKALEKMNTRLRGVEKAITSLSENVKAFAHIMERGREEEEELKKPEEICMPQIEGGVGLVIIGVILLIVSLLIPHSKGIGLWGQLILTGFSIFLIELGAYFIIMGVCNDPKWIIMPFSGVHPILLVVLVVSYFVLPIIYSVLLVWPSDKDLSLTDNSPLMFVGLILVCYFSWLAYSLYGFCVNTGRRQKLFFIFLLSCVLGGLVLALFFGSILWSTDPERSWEWVGVPVALFGAIVFFAVCIKESRLGSRPVNNNPKDNQDNRGDNDWLKVLEVFGFILLTIFLAYFSYMTAKTQGDIVSLEVTKYSPLILAYQKEKGENITLVNEGMRAAKCYCNNTPNDFIYVIGGEKASIPCCDNELVCETIYGEADNIFLYNKSQPKKIGRVIPCESNGK
jgi:hypothetical protein